MNVDIESQLTEAKKSLQPPESIRAYIEGEDGLPDLDGLETYHDWLQTVLPRKSYKLYRGFGWGAKLGSYEDIFSDSSPMSFTEDKETALYFAKDAVISDPYQYGYLISIEAPKDYIYFHWKFGGELGKSHPKEKEVLVLASGFNYKIEKEIKPQEESRVPELHENIRNEIGKLIGDEDFISDVEDYDGPEASLIPGIWDEIKGTLPDFDKKVRVYRVVDLEDLSKLNTKSLGVAWTWEEEAAHGWYGGEGDEYVLVADLPSESIDIWVTARQLIIHQSDEKEIRAEDDSYIYLIAIKDKQGKVVKEFNPPLKTKTGHSLFGGQESLVSESDETDFSEKYYTAFLFDCSPDTLHMTHHYLGEQTKENVEEILSTLKKYFKENPFISFSPSFDTEEMFGKEGDTRVLTAKINEKYLLLDLKSKLEKFRESDFDDYKPHVTTDREKVVDEPLVCYALLKDNKIVQKFEAVSKNESWIGSVLDGLDLLMEQLDSGYKLKSLKSTDSRYGNSLTNLTVQDGMESGIKEEVWRSNKVNPMNSGPKIGSKKQSLLKNSKDDISTNLDLNFLKRLVQNSMHQFSLTSIQVVNIYEKHRNDVVTYRVHIVNNQVNKTLKYAVTSGGLASVGDDVRISMEKYEVFFIMEETGHLEERTVGPVSDNLNKVPNVAVEFFEFWDEYMFKAASKLLSNPELESFFSSYRGGVSTVYRGIHLSKEDAEIFAKAHGGELKEGSVFTFKETRPTSWTHTPETAEGFIWGGERGEYGLSFEFDPSEEDIIVNTEVIPEKMRTQLQMLQVRDESEVIIKEGTYKVKLHYLCVSTNSSGYCNESMDEASVQLGTEYQLEARDSFRVFRGVKDVYLSQNDHRRQAQGYWGVGTYFAFDQSDAEDYAIHDMTGEMEGWSIVTEYTFSGEFKQISAGELLKLDRNYSGVDLPKKFPKAKAFALVQGDDDYNPPEGGEQLLITSKAKADIKPVRFWVYFAEEKNAKKFAKQFKMKVESHLSVGPFKMTQAKAVDNLLGDVELPDRDDQNESSEYQLEAKSSPQQKALDRVAKLGVKLSHEGDFHNFMVIAKKNEKIIGSLSVDASINRMHPNHVEVDKKWRRKGIATAMYDAPTIMKFEGPPKTRDPMNKAYKCEATSFKPFTLKQVMDSLKSAGRDLQGEDLRYEALDLMEFFASFPSKIKVYRVIHAKNKDQIKRENPGTHWTHSKNKAIQFASHELKKPWFLISGIIDRSKIDWGQTLFQNVHHPHEEEIYVPSWEVNSLQSLRVTQVESLEVFDMDPPWDGIEETRRKKDKTPSEDEIESALKFMKDAGLVPTGTGKHTLPKRSADHSVVWDNDEDRWFLIVELGNEGSLWAIDTDGRSGFVSNFKGKFHPGEGQDEYGEGEYADYVELPVMQAILDIVDPEWNKPGEGEEELNNSLKVFDMVPPWDGRDF